MLTPLRFGLLTLTLTAFAAEPTVPTPAPSPVAPRNVAPKATTTPDPVLPDPQQPPLDDGIRDPGENVMPQPRPGLRVEDPGNTRRGEIRPGNDGIRGPSAIRDPSAIRPGNDGIRDPGESNTTQPRQGMSVDPEDGIRDPGETRPGNDGIRDPGESNTTQPRPGMSLDPENDRGLGGDGIRDPGEGNSTRPRPGVVDPTGQPRPGTAPAATGSSTGNGGR